MNSKLILILFGLCFITLNVSGQKKSKDPVLFSVANTPVHLSEFNYIYTKTNAEKADFSRASLEEYLDLYIKFKLKVQRAKDMQMDTIQQLNQELAGYRRQLADSYLLDKQVTEKLVREVYDRSKEEVNISHILLALGSNASQEQEAEALAKIQAIKKQLDQGADFVELAKKESQDGSTAKNGGRIGFLKPIFPNGFYSLETAAYGLEPGEVSEPTRSKFGYHLIRLNEKRPARGEIEASHILIRTQQRTSEGAKAKIDSLYKALENGASFEEVARLHSEDKKTARSGGVLGFFGINKYEKDFEDAAFALKADEAYSKPVKSSTGWHIIKRISLRTLQPYNIEKRRLEAKVKLDERFNEARLAMVDRIQKESNFSEDTEALNAYINSTDQTLFARNWKPESNQTKAILFKFGEQYTVSTDDFGKMLFTSTRKRTSLRNKGVAEAIKSMYADFLIDETLKFEETQLEKKYPDFKSLMREYEEGILLFEATKMMVWDKASEDTLGLKKFYDQSDKKYMWNEIAEVSIYTVPDEFADKVSGIKDFARKNRPSEVLNKYNTEKNKMVSVKEIRLEKDKDAAAQRLNWKVGGISNDRQDSEGFTEFLKIENIRPARPKTLKEARGYIIADYQDYLEKQWIEKLKKDYKVKVYKKVFEGMVKS